jgi:hypothetical protein
MYQRGYFTKKDISRFVLANLRFRLTGKEKKEEIQRFQDAATDFIGGHNVADIQAIAEEIYDEFVSPALWKGTIDIAQTHIANGDDVYLVTEKGRTFSGLVPYYMVKYGYVTSFNDPGYPDTNRLVNLYDISFCFY